MADAASSSSAPVPAEGAAALDAVAEAAPPEEMTLVVKWRGQEQSVRMVGDDTLGELKLRICEVTGVLPKRQKLLYPKVIFNNLPDSTLLSAIPFKPNGKITMIG
jgi:ubiquitin-like domain-containing CTD phosphatase 1